MSTPLDDLNWRYATKKFDPNQKIDEGTIEMLLQSLRLVPSSMGLQPNKILLIKDPIIREKLVPAAHGQKQVAEASHLLVLVSYNELDHQLIDSFLNEVARVRVQDRQSLSGFENMLVNFASKNSAEEINYWMSKQNYIVLGHLLQICAQLRIDATPMEGFDRKQVDQILGLEERNLKTDLLIPIGFRSPEDPYLQRRKVRRPMNEVVEVI